MMKKLFKGLLTALLCVMLMAVFYLAVILGDPQEEDAAPQVTPMADQPLLTALPGAVFITDEGGLKQILDSFPAQVLHAGKGNALTFVQGQCSDVAYEGGLGRIVTLTYRTEDGGALTLLSIYPARALSLLGKGDYTISGTAGQTMAGMRSVRMETADSIRLHAQGPEAIYAMTAPRADGAVLRQYAAALQLAEGTD